MAKKIKPMVIDSMTIWEMRKPRYDGFACGHGPHSTTKYRRQTKADLKRAISKDQL
jgi:hypothetical protein